MSVSFRAISVPKDKSFSIRSLGLKGLSVPFHHHPEYELTLIVEGYGQRFIGSQMSDFNAGDLVLIGSNVPHCWRLNRNCKKASCIVIQFRYDFLGESFLNAPELTSVKNMLQNNKGAWVLLGILRQHITSNIQSIMSDGNSFSALIKLIHSLSIISQSDRIQVLEVEPISTSTHQTDNDKILAVYEYIQSNFKKGVEVDKAADLLNMNPTAFCKFFKRVTQKTFIQVVTAYRIELAIQLLASTGMSISEIATDSGFGDVSNFFKAFKKRTGYTPLQYRLRVK